VAGGFPANPRSHEGGDCCDEVCSQWVCCDHISECALFKITNELFYRYNLKMALLKEDNIFTHVIAIDFGTGASG